MSATMAGGAGSLYAEVQVRSRGYAVRLTRDGHAWTSGVAPFPESVTTPEARQQHAFTMISELLVALALPIREDDAP